MDVGVSEAVKVGVEVKIGVKVKVGVDVGVLDGVKEFVKVKV